MSNADATILSGVAALVGGAIGFWVRWVLDRRARWDTDRHRSFTRFWVAAYWAWDCIDADGDCVSESYAIAMAELRRTYVAAMLICRRTQTSDALDQVHDRIALLYNVVTEESIDQNIFRAADRDVYDALEAFGNSARRELGLPTLDAGSYDDWLDLWGRQPTVNTQATGT